MNWWSKFIKTWWGKMIVTIILVIIACVVQHYFMNSDIYQSKIKPTFQKQIRESETRIIDNHLDEK